MVIMFYYLQMLVDITALAVFNLKLHEKFPDRVPEAVHKIIAR